MRMKKSKTGYENHLTTCPHCDKDVLDHMVECIFCKGELKPYYRPMEKNRAKQIRAWLTVVLTALALLIVLLELL
ncbi:MAG TPA: hypothetical protein DCG34_07245 [Clostridiales bacterium]|jgi:hypothetical protein|nr:hypothetical protein [Clostridiales bacterium]